MNKKHLTLAVLIVLFLPFALSAVYAAERGRTYNVTITNVTRGQIISPPIVFSHSGHFNLFELGQPASDVLAKLAEDGMTAPLEAELLTSPSIFSVATASGGLLPGASITIQVQAGGPYRFISAAGMLVSSNDAFFAAHGVRLPRGGSKTVMFAEAYDAGSEANSESCDFIPGPPCGNPEVRDTEGAEGYVHVHAGIQGVGDLVPEEFDWRNPVVRISIQAVNEK